ncbi:MAG: hypothetical protein C5B50_22960 [Verrucomicrobia bacterium]|nr:MAG: hypothetical protein C5B50_22960 [Verrucomicrobiota bacterium]
MMDATPATNLNAAPTPGARTASSAATSERMSPSELPATSTDSGLNPPGQGRIPAAHASFFRQSGWLMISQIAGGMLMWGLHFLPTAFQKVHGTSFPKGEYGVFGSYLALLMLLPDLPLQMVLAQQTARALASGNQRQLSGIIRRFWLALLLVWLAAAVALAIRQPWVLAHYQLPGATGLWLTMFAALLSLWMPMFGGVMQGQQNFLWYGWNQIINGIGRVGIAFLAVLAFRASSTGMMAGALIGLVAATALPAWQTLPLWKLRPEPANWRNLLDQILPLIIGFIGFKILFMADTIFVKGNFSGAEADFYTGAGTLSRALMWLVLPLAAVMFPKLVHSAAKSEKTNLMGIVFGGTAVLAIGGVVFFWVVRYWLVRIYPAEYRDVIYHLLPWYSSAMVPLALANVLLNNMLARPASKLPAALCILGLSIGYLFALHYAVQASHHLETVLKTMGLCNLILMGVCAGFTWLVKKDT